MEINILDFVSFIQFKNGKYKVTHNENNIENIFLLLREMGYGYIKKNGRSIYFKKEGRIINLATLNEFKKAFFNTIKDCDSSALPGNISLLDVYKYYRNTPFRKDELFERYFEHSLTEDQLENFNINSRYSLDKKEVDLR